MTRAVKDPLLKDLPADVVELDRAGVGHAVWRLATRHHLGQRRLLPCLGDDMVAVDRVDGPNGGDAGAAPFTRARSAPVRGNAPPFAGAGLLSEPAELQTPAG